MFAHFIVKPLLHFLLPDGRKPRWYHYLAASVLIVLWVVLPLGGAFAASVGAWVAAADCAAIWLFALAGGFWLRSRLRAPIADVAA